MGLSEGRSSTSSWEVFQEDEEKNYMHRQFLLTNQDDSGDGWATYWTGNSVTVTHDLGKDYIVGLLDDEEHEVSSGKTIVRNENELVISFPEALSDVDTFTVNIINFIGDFTTTTYELGEHYSGTVENVLLFCKSLDISSDKLSNFQYPRIVQMQILVDDAIDGYLNEYYFTPLGPFNQVQLDGTVRKVFPGKIRMLALQWTAGLMLQTEFQNLEPNMNEQAQRFVEESKKEMQHIVDFSVRIPGQRRKYPSPTMPPNLAPSKTQEFLN